MSTIRFPQAEKNGLEGASRLPFSLKVLLENLLRFEDGRSVTADDIRAVAEWLDNRGKEEREIAYRPARVLMQDFTGVPAVVDLAAMRDAIAGARRRSAEDQPAGPGRPGHRPLGDGRRIRHARRLRAQRRRCEYERNMRALRLPEMGPERLRQLPRRAARHRHLPPGQPRIPRADRLDQRRSDGETVAYPDTLVGTDATPPWSTAWPCSAGASAASRPRPRCSASRSRC